MEVKLLELERWLEVHPNEHKRKIKGNLDDVFKQINGITSTDVKMKMSKWRNYKYRCQNEANIVKTNKYGKHVLPI